MKGGWSVVQVIAVVAWLQTADSVQVVNAGPQVGPLTPLYPGGIVQTPKGLRSIGLEGFSEDVDMDGFVDPLIDLSSNSVAARTILNSGYQRWMVPNGNTILLPDNIQANNWLRTYYPNMAIASNRQVSADQTEDLLTRLDKHQEEHEHLSTLGLHSFHETHSDNKSTLAKKLKTLSMMRANNGSNVLSKTSLKPKVTNTNTASLRTNVQLPSPTIAPLNLATSGPQTLVTQQANLQQLYTNPYQNYWNNFNQIYTVQDPYQTSFDQSNQQQSTQSPFQTLFGINSLNSNLMATNGQNSLNQISYSPLQSNYWQTGQQQVSSYPTQTFLGLNNQQQTYPLQSNVNLQGQQIDYNTQALNPSIFNLGNNQNQLVQQQNVLPEVVDARDTKDLDYNYFSRDGARNLLLNTNTGDMTQATLLNLLNNQNNGLLFNTLGDQNLMGNNLQTLQQANNPIGQQTVFTNRQSTNPTLNLQSLLPYTDSNGRITYPLSNLNNPSQIINPRLNLNTNNNQLVNEGRQSVNQVTPDYQSTVLYTNPNINGNSLNQQLLNSNLQRTGNRKCYNVVGLEVPCALP